MPHRKITAFASAASAQASTVYPVVSGGNANKIITQHTMLQSLGVPQYVEGTCRATATVAVLPRCNIFDIYTRILIGSSVAAGGSIVNVGVGTNAIFYTTIPTSGISFVRTSVNAFENPNSLIGASGAVVAAAPTASAGASFVVGIGYFRT